MRVADLPLTSSVRITALNLVVDDSGFFTDSKEAWPRLFRNAAPTQAPPDAMKERRDRTRTKALPRSFPKGEFRLHRIGDARMAAALDIHRFSILKTKHGSRLHRGFRECSWLLGLVCANR